MLLTLLLAACPTPEPEPIPETGQPPDFLEEPATAEPFPEAG